MPYTPQHDAARLWVKRLIDESVVIHRSGSLHHTRDSITHFQMELAYAYPNEDGSLRLLLLNGDEYRGASGWAKTTWSIQEELRSAAVSLGVPHVILPYSALDGAGLEHGSIRVIDQTPERREYLPRTATLDDLPRHLRDSVIKYRSWVAQGSPTLWRDAWWTWGCVHKVTGERVARPPYGKWSEYEPIQEPYKMSAPYLTVTEHPDPQPQNVGQEPRTTWDGSTFQWWEYRHWLGEAVIEATTTTARRRCPDAVPIHLEGWQCPHEEHERGLVVIPPRTAYYLSGWDHNEYPRRSYFLCELPPGQVPTSVTHAYEMLKPETVRFAEALGREVKRQGDVFFIPIDTPTRALTRAGGVRHRMKALLTTNHTATEVIEVGGQTFARGIARHEPRGRAPDHKKVHLGKQWHLVLKNLVPLAG